MSLIDVKRILVLFSVLAIVISSLALAGLPYGELRVDQTYGVLTGIANGTQPCSSAVLSSSPYLALFKTTGGNFSIRSLSRSFFYYDYGKNLLFVQHPSGKCLSALPLNSFIKFNPEGNSWAKFISIVPRRMTLWNRTVDGAFYLIESSNYSPFPQVAWTMAWKKSSLPNKSYSFVSDYNGNPANFETPFYYRKDYLSRWLEKLVFEGYIAQSCTGLVMLAEGHLGAAQFNYPLYPMKCTGEGN